jgi:pyroglutamyl-peptidase
MRVVIAGFGPFPGAPSNPSGRLATALARRRRPAFAGVEMTSHVFATAYAAVDRDLPKLLAEKPDAVLIFGVAARRRYISIERRARNARSPLLPDVNGYRPENAVIERGKVRALSGNGPFASLLNAVRRTALPARLSHDAGSYLCNYAYWRVLRHVRNGRPLVQFVHIPWVALTPRRGTHGRRSPSLSRLMTAGENLLIALLAAWRQPRALTSAMHPLPGSSQPRNRSSCAKLAARSARVRRARSPRRAKTAR